MNHNTELRGVCRLASTMLVLASAAAPVKAQTHKVAKPESVVRAVGVYEWTGDLAKPNASRMVPVSLYIDGKLRDAGEYLARPVPMALLTGNVYELDQAGLAKGNLDLVFSRRFENNGLLNTTYDDGWFGYGKFVLPAPPKKSNLKPTATLAVINPIDDEDDPRPHFSSKSAKPGSGGSAGSVPGAAPTASDTPPSDPDRPTLHRPAGNSGPASSGSTASDAPASDPDRPTMRRPSDTPDSTASDSAKADSPPADDPDRPTLRRRAPEDAKKAKSSQASVTDAGPSLNDDPNRPTLHRGKPEGGLSDADLPKLSGLPGDQDLHQMIAVSDGADRPAHDFSRPWVNEAEHQELLAKMRAAARAQLVAYSETGAKKPPILAPADTRHPNSKMRRAVTPDAPAAAEPLLDEQLRGYTLSYGGAATFVYSAHTGGLGPAQRFVTLVAQVDTQGEPAIALKSITDAAHLDRTPRMKLVDVVDAEASNRASLLFELREQSSRQFALYRVIGARADQTFLTGTTQ